MTGMAFGSTIPFMSLQVGHKIGGRGCPSCGSHDTECGAHGGVQWCVSCRHRWVPCRPRCKGYSVEIGDKGPNILGCRDCGVPDKIARWWPEAYRAAAALLADRKLEPVG